MVPRLKRRLGEVAYIYAGLPTRPDNVREAQRSGNLLTVRALTASGIDVRELMQANIDGRNLEKYRVKAGDVVLSSRSTSVRTAVVPPELEGTIINATLIGIRCLPELDPRLLVALFNHPTGRAALENVSQSATHQMNITVSGLNRIEVPVPPPEEQRHLVELLETADAAYNTAMESAGLRHSLAQSVAIARALELTDE